MSDIKGLIAEARAKLNIGEDEKVDTGVIKGFLTEIERQSEDLHDNLRTANSESKGRKEKIRELTGTIESRDDEIVTLKGQKNPNDELVVEVKKLREFKTGWLETQKKNFQSEFTKIVDHSNFDKAKKKFILPEKEKGKDWDFTTLKDEDVEHNFNALNELNELEYFGEVTKPPGSPGKYKTQETKTDLGDRLRSAKGQKERDAIIAEATGVKVA